MNRPEETRKGKVDSEGDQQVLMAIVTEGNKPRWKAVQRYPKNELGRDFVIGDVHGAYDTVLMAMGMAKFDPSRDRLFSVGDLIDRGPGSFRVRKFLAQPYVFACRGNHEDMLLELYEDGEPDPAVVEFMASRNGFGWWLDMGPADREGILEAIRQLPIAMEVETSRGTVGMIHADVPAGMNWKSFLAEIEAGDPHTIKTALWGRERLNHQVDCGVDGIDRLFVGHTPQWDGLKRLGNVYAIDTGAVFAELGHQDDAKLTMVNIMTDTVVLDRTLLAELVDLRDEMPSQARRFGSYTNRQSS